MKIQKIKMTKRIIPALVLASILLITGAVFAVVQINRNSSENALPSNGNVSEPILKSDDEQAQNLDKDPAGKEEFPNSDQPSTPTGSNEGKKQVQVIASVDKSADSVFIRGGVNYPVSSGVCYAALQGPSGQTVRKDTTLLPNPASADCKTISIPISELSPGKWTFTLHYTSDNYEGISDEVSFNI